MSISRRNLLKGASAAGFMVLGSPAGLALAQSGPTLKIGVSVAMTGVGAQNGLALVDGIKIAQAQYNKAGGLNGKQIELVIRDDKYSGAGSVAAIRELAGSGVNLIIGGSQTVTALAVLPILEELKVVLLIPAAAGMAITHEAFSRNAFRTTGNVLVQYGALGRAMAERFPDITKWQSVIPDSSFGRDSGRLFDAAVKQYHAKRTSKDFKVLDPMLVSATQTDFRSQISTLMNSGVEGIFYAAVGAPEISFFQQARAVGLDKKLKLICEAGGDAVAKQLGKDMPASFWGPVFWPYMVDPYRKNPVSQALYKDWMAEKHDPFPPTLINLGYRGAQALFEGVKKAKSSENEAVIKAMEGLQFESVAGPYHIRPKDHQGLGTIFIAQFVASQKEPFFEVKTVQAVSEEGVAESPSPGAEYVL